MATREFHVNTEPHVANVPGGPLYFRPEINGSEFASNYAILRSVQAKLKSSGGSKASSTKHAKEEDVSPELLAEVSVAMSQFVRKLLVPDSQPVFDDLHLPDRVLISMIEWVGELYGGGSGNPDDAGGTSTG